MFDKHPSLIGGHTAAVARPAAISRGIPWLLACTVACAGLFVSGCKSVAGPDYTRPDLPEKSTWVAQKGLRTEAAAAIEPGWWQGFGDPQLNELVDQAIAGDFDLQVAALNVEKAGIDIEAKKDETFQRSVGANISNNTQFKQGQGTSSTNNFAFSATFSYEVDLWGKIRKGLDAKKAAYQGTQAEWRVVYLTLVSNVATKYFELLQFDEQMKNQAQSLATNRKLLGIYEAQYREGLLPKSRILSQRAEISTLEKERLELERQRKVAQFQLATLLGKPAGSIEIPAGNLTRQISVLEVPAGLPSDLLARRPDILAREYDVLRSHNLVGEARLAKLPSLKLTGSAGTSSSLLSGLLKSWTFGLAPSISIPIFDPNIQRNIKTTTIDMKISQEQYRKTVVKAFEEVETALLNLDYRKRQKDLLADQIKNLKVVRDVQYAQLQEGLVSQLEVFETERSLLSARQSLLTTHQQVLADTVTLYKALGGGWPPEYVTVQVPTQ